MEPRLLFALYLILLATLPGTPAAAATLRTEVVVTGSQIRLGDLFAGLAPQESLQAVATAPTAGGEVVLDPEWIVRVARTYGVDWQPDYRVPSVTIRRADPFEEADAESAVRAALSQVIAAGTVPSPTDGVEEIASPEPPPEDLVPESEIPVLTRRVPADDVITAADIAWQTLPESRVGPGLAVSADELIGMSARRLLNADQPVRLADLQLPVVVPRGDTVSMLLEAPGLRITARGRALENGALGQTIRVVNVDSNRIVDAVVVAANAVAVVPAVPAF